MYNTCFLTGIEKCHICEGAVIMDEENIPVFGCSFTWCWMSCDYCEILCGSKSRYGQDMGGYVKASHVGN